MPSLKISDEQYSEVVSGKKIIIVGPASYMSSSNKGPYIDSFDLVVRLNRGIFVAERVPQHLGSKSDLLYTAMQPDPKEHDFGSGPIDPVKWKKLGVKVVTIKNAYSHKEHKKRFESENKVLEYRILPKDVIGAMQADIGVENLHAGVIAINDLLRFPIAELHLCGMTFYQTPGYYMKEYHPAWTDIFHDTVVIGASKSKHDGNNEFTQFVRLFQTDKRIFVDNVLKEIVEGVN